MGAEWSPLLSSRARVHAALAEPARLAIVDQLVLGDVAPGELTKTLDLPSNLVAHHVNVLEEAGVLVRSRSNGDRRRTYLSLVASTLAELMPVRGGPVRRVVFVCTHNSARSQLAAALWARRSEVPGTSAGTAPAWQVHPRAVAVGRRYGLQLADAQTTNVADVLRPGDLVVAVCDNAYEQLVGGSAVLLHWSVPDPADTDDDEAFERALLDISARVDRLAAAVVPVATAVEEPA